MVKLSGGLTVLLPLHNCSKYIGASVRSILNQNYSDFELLIIDDGSTDNSAEAVSRIKDSRISTS
jgi:glycosyltransferase involved in cell wall biosynthesis